MGSAGGVPAPPLNGTELPPPYEERSTTTTPAPPHAVAVTEQSSTPYSSYAEAQQNPPVLQSQRLVGAVEEQEEWSSDLFDCTGANCSNFCLSCWCPCIIFGQNVEIIDRGRTSCGVSGSLYALLLVVAGFHFVYSCVYRTKLRNQMGIAGDVVTDCCVHFWCEGCALSQEYRHLQSKGYDVSLGWYGNMVKQNQGVGMMTTAPPAVHNGMTRS